ncbi:MAG: YkgJ family cysteine cluster protein [bacterium]
MIDPATFQCARCGACCRVPGTVALQAGEPETIAAFLGLDVYAFTAAYTTLMLNRSVLSLIESEDGRCVFLQDDNTCRIQPVKPAQCTGFPFLWRSKTLERNCAALKQARTGSRTVSG